MQTSGMFDHLSYQVHTGRELELMLKGVKPLAVFSDLVPGTALDGPMSEFEPHVRSGAIIKHEFAETWEPGPAMPNHPTGRRRVLYALPGEAWRIPAYLLLRTCAGGGRCSDTLERLEGSLLGYTEAETDEWLASRARHHAGWGCVTVHAVTNDTVLEEIDELGRRAFPKAFIAGARFFLAHDILSGAMIERAGLAMDPAGAPVLRFGLETSFFVDRFVRTDAEPLALLAIRPGTGMRALNAALATTIEVVEPV